MESLFFIWFWWDFLWIPWEITFRKSAMHYFVTSTVFVKSGPKWRNFKFFNFFIVYPILMLFFCCKMITIMGYWWTIKNWYFISKRGPNSKIMHIFRHTEFVFSIQFWCSFFCYNLLSWELPVVLICQQVSPIPQWLHR